MQRYSFDFHKKFELSGYGANPERASARSKTDKTLAGLLQNVSGDVMQFYELRNVSQYHIADQTTRQIIRLKLASVATARVEIHININLETTAAPPEEITKATVTYIIDGDEKPLHPEETYIDGKHVMHLMYIIPLTENVTSYFRVYMKADGGDIFIDRNGAWLYAGGYGIVGDGVWDGTFDLDDETHGYSIREITFEDITAAAAITLQAPTPASPSDNTRSYSLSDVGFLSDTADQVRITMHNTADERVLENNTDTRVLEDETGMADADIRYTEEEIS